MHCPMCHREVQGPRKRCLYCGAPLPVEEAAADNATPLPAPPAASEEPGMILCPRCRQAMVSTELSGVRFTRCAQCRGLWLDGATFDFLIARQAAMTQQSPPEAVSPRYVQRGTGEERVHYIVCPVCSKQMARTNYAKCSGVIFDQCRLHGVWLDEEELQQILTFIATGGHALAAVIQAEAEGRMQADARRREWQRQMRNLGAEPH